MPPLELLQHTIDLPGVIKPKPLSEKNLTFPVQAIFVVDI